MDTHNICFYKEVDKKKYAGSNLKTIELLDKTREQHSALIGVCAVKAIKVNVK